MAKWLVHWTPEQMVQIQALAGDTVLCSWARHCSLAVPFSTQVHKWVPANLILEGNPAMDYHPIQGGVEIHLVTSCYRNRDKLRPDGLLGSNADFKVLSHGILSYFCHIQINLSIKGNLKIVVY